MQWITILNGKTGHPLDMWTASSTAFTSLIFVVNFNLFTRIGYITWLHAMSILLTSITPYLVYMWIGNFMSPEWSLTHNAIMEAHKSPTFYLKVGICIGICFLGDYAIECYDVLIKTSPINFLRILVNRKLDLDDGQNLQQFNKLVDEEERKYRQKMSI